MLKIDELPVGEFLEKLAAPDFPSPASGSAAATAAAMAAALLEMSCQVTLKKDGEKRDLAEQLKKAQEIRKHCLFLATEDMKAYGEVVKSIKLKKESPDEYEDAMQKATDTLIGLVKNCLSILTQMEEIIDICYVKALGDLGGGAYLAEAAAAAAKMGVEVNLRLLHDKSYQEENLAFVQESYQKIMAAKKRIVSTIIS